MDMKSLITALWCAATVGINAETLLEFGHTDIAKVEISGNRLLSQGRNNEWILWDRESRKKIITGVSTFVTLQGTFLVGSDFATNATTVYDMEGTSIFSNTFQIDTIVFSEDASYFWCRKREGHDILLFSSCGDSLLNLGSLYPTTSLHFDSKGGTSNLGTVFACHLRILPA